jgi:hypothetical protein
MAEPENEKRVDDLLDSLLSEYSAAEPRPGLEMRIRAGLKAHARQRRRQWALVFAGSAALVILAVLIARTRRPQETAPSRVAVQKTSPEPAPIPINAVEPAPHRAGSTTTDERRARLRNRPDSRILLQVANAMPQPDNMIFAHEKLYLSPTPQPEQQPAVEEHASAPDISIQHLGVRPIEIKDLTSAKDMN